MKILSSILRIICGRQEITSNSVANSLLLGHPIYTLSANTSHNLKNSSNFLGHVLRSNEQHAHKKALGMQALQGFVYAYCSQITAYLFENCGALRAALRPYFLRSFIRGSRVKNPAFLSTGLYSASACNKALEIP